jgi:hypothetical protein
MPRIGPPVQQDDRFPRADLGHVEGQITYLDPVLDDFVVSHCRTLAMNDP